ncbi:MAG: hypothetical protein LBV08_07680 [Clostridiales bacterium]|nr:hypothetical protein [Clostridiales bacterium]
MIVYLLQHSYEYEITEGEIVEETKIIGIYDSKENAECTKNKFKTKKGFNRYSDDCFYIDAYELNQDHWTDGFATWNNADDNWIE